MRRGIAALLLAVGLGLGLAACSSGPTSGVVTEKLYTPAESYTLYIPMPCGKGCFIIVPIHEDDPPTWSLQLKDHGQTGWVNVDQQTYDDIQVGAYYGTKIGA